jgi:tRNA (guanine-N7-)-methyltransferase
MNIPDTVSNDLPHSDDHVEDHAEDHVEDVPAPDNGDADDSSPDPSKPHPLHRRLKSFVKRAGRTTDGQARAFAELGPLFLLPYTPEPLDLSAAFGGREAPTVLEIGFGMGEATAHIATVLPETNFLCCEVHEPGVGALLKRIGEQGFATSASAQHDAVDVLDHMLRPARWPACTSSFPTRGTRSATTSAA